MILLLLATLALVQPVSNSATGCAIPLTDGLTVSGAYPSVEFGHSLSVSNGSGSVAYVKLRNVLTEQRTLVFLEKGGSGTIDNIPDGSYEVLFAFGGRLAEDCEFLIQPKSVSKFAGTKRLDTKITETASGREIETAQWSFTLYTVPSGNVRPVKIPVAEFNRD